MKTEVYSWRISPERKMALEAEARRSGKTFAALLDHIAEDWLLARTSVNSEDSEEQARLQAAAARTFGSISGSDPLRGENARLLIRKRLQKRHAA
jgi:hypothetical protein